MAVFPRGPAIGRISCAKLRGLPSQALVVHLSPSHHIIVGKGDGVKMHKTSHVLIPGHAFLRDLQQLIRRWFSNIFKSLQGRMNILAMSFEGSGQGNGVFKGRPGSGADGEMDRPQSVADQYDLVMPPAPVPNHDEIDPDRLVR